MGSIFMRADHKISPSAEPPTYAIARTVMFGTMPSPLTELSVPSADDVFGNAFIGAYHLALAAYDENCDRSIKGKQMSGVLQILIEAAVVALVVAAPFLWWWLKDRIQGKTTGDDKELMREKERDRFNHDDMFSDRHLALEDCSSSEAAASLGK
jgi:hypothetical protein